MEVYFKGEVWYFYTLRRSYFDTIKKSNPQCMVEIWRNNQTEVKTVLMEDLTLKED